MILFPHCKINLGLRILQKRSDGFHDIETVFLPIPLKDILEILPSQKKEEVDFSSSGLPIPGDPSNNLCIKAFSLLKQDFPKIPGVRMHLHKNIPMGGGLGGGSSDASFTLMMLNEMFDVGLDKKQLEAYALKTGSDCPFFLHQNPCYATGRGEILEEIVIDLSSYKVVLVHPGIQVSTAWAYSRIRPGTASKKLETIINQAIETWKEELVNDFETICFPEYPDLKKIKEGLYSRGAVYASMSGSGSSIFGFFAKNNEPDLSDLNYDFSQLML